MAAIRFFDLTAALSLAWIAAEWLRRVVWITKLRRVNPPLEPSAFPEGAPMPSVTVVVPARNEERNIENCLTHLFRQSYGNLDLVVVDDRSDDRTPAILEEAARRAPRPLKIVRLEKLPPGWTGKTHAMHAGSRAACGEWLLFTDADTSHDPHSVSTAVQTALSHGIDVLTLAPQTECRTFWEKTVQPLAVSSLALWFRTERVNDDRTPVLVNGQFILVSRACYDALGGSEAVKNEVVEDVAFGRLARRAGKRVRFLNGTRLYRTRMYSTLSEIRRGWTRILTFLFEKSLTAIFHKVFLNLFFSIWPFALAALELFWRASGSALHSPALLGASAAVSLFIVAMRVAGNRTAHTDPKYALLHPLGALIMVWILLECAYRIVFRKPSEWRGQMHA